MCNAEIKSLHDVSSTGNSENICHVVITERGLCAHGLPAQIERAATEFTPKPRCVIVREKDLAVDAYEGLFHQVLTVTAQHQIPTMVHGQPDLAFRLVQQQIQHGTPSVVAGVHLPLAQWAHWRQAHPDEAEFLVALGHSARQFPCGVGVSVHSLEDAIAAEQLGVSYVMAGHIFDSSCKPGVPPRGLSLLHEITSRIQVPVYAIGGFGWADPKSLLAVAAGATGVAVRSAAMTL